MKAMSKKATVVTTLLVATLIASCVVTLIVFAQAKEQKRFDDFFSNAKVEAFQSGKEAAREEYLAQIKAEEDSLTATIESAEKRLAE